MHTSHNRLIAMTVVAASLLGQAQAISFNASYDGISNIIDVIDPGPPIVRFQTDSTGTGTLDLTTYESSDVVNLATGVGNGANIFTAGNGDKLFGTFDVQITPTGNPAVVNLAGQLTFAGGTGMFAGAFGSATLNGVGTFTSPTSADSHLEFVGDVTLVPEPVTMLALLPGVYMAVRRRKSTR